MKILLVNDYLDSFGGAEKVVYDTKNLLEENGHEVLLLGGNNSFLSNFSRWFSVYYYFKTLLIIDSFKPDVVHCHNISRSISPSPLIAAKIRKIPTVMTFHDYHMVCPKTWMIYSDGNPCKYGYCNKCLYSNCYTNKRGILNFPYHWLKWFKVLLHRYIIRNTVNIAICPNHDLQESVKKSLGLKTVYLPNFYDFKEKVVPKKCAKYFLFVGRLSMEKGIIELITTFSKIPNENLTIIGDGPLKVNLLSLIKNFRLENRVTVLGKIDNSKLAKYYQEAYALIIPSIWKENNPLVALESLYNNTPLIVRNVGGLPDFIRNKTGSIMYKNTTELISIITKFHAIKIQVFFPCLYTKIYHLKRLVKIYNNTL